MSRSQTVNALKRLLARVGHQETPENVHWLVREAVTRLFSPPEQSGSAKENAPQRVPVDPHHRFIKRLIQRQNYTLSNLKWLKWWRLGKNRPKAKTLALARHHNLWWPILDGMEDPAIYQWPGNVNWSHVIEDSARLERFDIARYALARISPEERISTSIFQGDTPGHLALLREAVTKHADRIWISNTPRSVEELDIVAAQFHSQDYELAARLRLGGLDNFLAHSKTKAPGACCLRETVDADQTDWLAALLAHPEFEVSWSEVVAAVLQEGAAACWAYLCEHERRRLARTGRIEFDRVREYKRQENRPLRRLMTEAVRRWPTHHLSWSDRATAGLGLKENDPETERFIEALCDRGYTLGENITHQLEYFREDPTASRLAIQKALSFKWDGALPLLRSAGVSNQDKVLLLTKTQPHPGSADGAANIPYANLSELPNHDEAAQRFIALLPARVRAEEIVRLDDISQVSDDTLRQLLARTDVTQLSDYDYRSLFRRPDTRLERLIAEAGGKCPKPAELLRELRHEREGKERPKDPVPVLKLLFQGQPGLKSREFLEQAFDNEQLSELGDWALSAGQPEEKSNGYWQAGREPATILARRKDWDRFQKYCLQARQLEPAATTLTAILENGEHEIARQLVDTWPGLREEADQDASPEVKVAAARLGVKVWQQTAYGRGQRRDSLSGLAAMLAAGLPLKGIQKYRLLQACRRNLDAPHRSSWLLKGECLEESRKILALLVPVKGTGRTQQAWREGTLDLRFLRKVPPRSLDVQTHRIKSHLRRLEKESRELDRRTFTIRHESGAARWRKIARQEPPHPSLENELPLGFNGEEYFAILGLLKLEASATETNLQGLELPAFNLQIVYGTLEEADKTLKKSQLWQEAKTPWHDFGQYTLPKNDRWDIGAWRQLLAHHAGKGHHLLRLAPLIERHLGRPPRTLREAEEISNLITYSRAAENHTLAQLARQAGLSNEEFEDYLEFMASNNKPAESCPHLRLNGAELGDQTLVFEKLNHDDPLGPMLGLFTGCCQHLHGAAKACAKHGATKPEGAFYVLRRGKRILGQSWAWRTGKTLVFDSWESPNHELGKKYCAPILMKAAKGLVGRLGIAEVRLGTGGNTPELNLPKAAKATTPPRGYSDAREQYILSDGAS